MIERMAKFAPPRHRELVQGMVAELDSIGERAERARFALGAVAAIARLAISEYGRSPVHSLGGFVGLREPEVGANAGGPSMSQPTTPQLLRRHATPFAVSFASLTALLVANHAVRLVPQLSTRGVSANVIAEALLLTVPFTLALTIPMAVFMAVSWAFARLGAEGVLATARRERHGIRRVVAPVLGAAAVIAALTFVSNTQVVPRANARLAAVIQGAPSEPTDRTMTIGELREAARRAQTATGEDAAARAAAYEVEVQKKFALAVACIVLALVGAATAIRFPHGGIGLVLGASVLVFAGYYVLLVTGETLADRGVLSPLLAMWMANAVFLAFALLLLWRPSRPDPTRGGETLAING